MAGRYESSAWAQAWFVESGTQGHVPVRVQMYGQKRDVHGLCRVVLAVAVAAVVDGAVAVDGVDGVLCAHWNECSK